ncbi:DNAH3 [Cordylochernes scorpioides]|uniref:DNAH3 n=1 Tax=Cordylochernes scorpioides TaxID=51811 RepID=A0ABY6LFN0_9ARAC|nr:DNAH3 [Cordylochernes scorpioides]
MFAYSRFITIAFNFSAHTSAMHTQDIIMSKLDRRRKGVFGPGMGRKCVVFIDDLNMPEKDAYDSQPPIELLRQWLNHGQWFDKKDTSKLEIVDVLLVGAMSRWGGLSRRFLHHLVLVGLCSMEDSTLSRIFQAVIDWHFSSAYDSSITRLARETKLNEKYNLKHKNYNILRKDTNKEGGGLAFLIKNLYYEDIAINIPNTSDLEAQEISTKTKTSSIKEKFWDFKKANWNLYQQNTNEDFGKAPTRIKDLEQNWISFKNTIIKAAKVSIPRALIIFPMKKINMKELDYALENTDLNKTPGPDGIHGQMISNLGKNGKERLLGIFNNSWKTGKLPQD